jgi:hypothetical protein
MPEYDARTSVTIELDFPVNVGGLDVARLTMRRPKTRDSLKAAKLKTHEAERGVVLLADLCDVSPDVIGELDEVDARKLGEQLDAFRGGQTEA